ncbi:MAG: hypothetical protein OXB95_02030 [Rhodobacteraceae bacterium]|nr:hypothetical protein [Paracoccaceae bacterium]
MAAKRNQQMRHREAILFTTCRFAWRPRQPPFKPALPLKLYLYCHLERMRSRRRPEAAMRYNVKVM